MRGHDLAKKGIVFFLISTALYISGCASDADKGKTVARLDTAKVYEQLYRLYAEQEVPVESISLYLTIHSPVLSEPLLLQPSEDEQLEVELPNDPEYNFDAIAFVNAGEPVMLSSYRDRQSAALEGVELELNFVLVLTGDASLAITVYDNETDANQLIGAVVDVYDELTGHLLTSQISDEAGVVTLANLPVERTLTIFSSYENIMADFSSSLTITAAEAGSTIAGEIYIGYEAEPVEVDSDGDGVYESQDCNDRDPNNWDSCALCLDTDNDEYFSGCDAYETINGPDCDAADADHWADCSTCTDADGDGYGAGCDLGVDCDDSLITGETCNTGCTVYYDDTDSDGYGNTAISVTTCSQPGGYVANNTDCDINSADHWSDCGSCTDMDSDGYGGSCDLGADCDDSSAVCNSGCSVYYNDTDGDGYGDLTLTVTACVLPDGYVTDGTDCDTSSSAHWADCLSCTDADGDGYGSGCDLGADCDDDVTTGGACTSGCTTYYDDSDADGYGDIALSLAACSLPTGYVANSTDCDISSADHWADCVSCTDADGDGYGLSCDLGADCDDDITTGGTCFTGCATFYEDTDGDGFGDALTTQDACSAPSGFVADGSDCDLASADHWADCGSCTDNDLDGYGLSCDLGADCDDDPITGGACFTGCTTYYDDSDGDSFGDIATPLDACSTPVGYVADSSDCDTASADHWADCVSCTDADADGYGLSCDLGADCDDDITTGPSCYTGCTTYYDDTDGDSYGDSLTMLDACTIPVGYVADSSDCDIASADHWSDCGSCTDNDLDGYGSLCDLGADCDDDVVTGSACYTGCSTYWLDSDVDTFGDNNYPLDACSMPTNYVMNNTDCDDTSEFIKPDAAYNELAGSCTKDEDSDGYGDSGIGTWVSGTDCDDSSASISPIISETAYDSIDQNCDGYDLCDMDGDLYWPGAVTMPMACPPSEQAGDCDDTDPAIKPTAKEKIYDGVDNDCDERTPDDDIDQDGFVYALDCNDFEPLISPASLDIADDGEDQDCDGFDHEADIYGGVFVSAAFGNDENTGAPWDPLESVTAAVELLSLGAQEIYIAQGDYRTNLIVSGVPVARIYGGYLPSAGWIRDPYNYETKIIADDNNSVIETYGLDASSVIDGIKLYSEQVFSTDKYCVNNQNGSTPRISFSGCELVHSFSGQGYGFAYLGSYPTPGTPVVVGNWMQLADGDSATSTYGIHISGYEGSYIRGNKISDNTVAGQYVYGIYLNMMPTDASNVVEGNAIEFDAFDSSSMQTVGIYVMDAPVLATNNLISLIDYTSISAMLTGFSLSTTSQTVITNNTIAMRANSSATGLSIMQPNTCDIANNIFFADMNGIEAISEFDVGTDVRTVANNVFYGFSILYNDYDTNSKADVVSMESMTDVPGRLAGNLNIHPNFVDFYNGDYHLMMSSPAINAGYPHAATAARVVFDLEGVYRPVREVVDVGALEYIEDSDFDGLDDQDEIYYATTDGLADSDSDGIDDGEEVFALGTDPNSNDTDMDGLLDGDELAQGSKPLLTDSDFDTYSDGSDNCPGIANDQTDSDGDGKGDECDKCPLDNPDDTDGDNVCDSDDSSPSDPLVCGIDVDSDGCDDCANGQNQYWNDGSDIDGDLICDSGDEDADGDGYKATGFGGDDCNDFNAQVNTGAQEVYYDGIDNDCNPDSPDDDIDMDGYSAVIDCDDFDYLTNPDRVDIPQDGLDQDCNGADHMASAYSGIYVSTTAGDDMLGTGAPWDPLRSVTAAVELLGDNLFEIYIEGGVYPESVSIANVAAARLYGGYGRTGGGWVRDIEMYPTYLQAASAPAVIETYGLDNTSVIDGLTVYNESPNAEYGIANYEGSEYTLSRVEVKFDRTKLTPGSTIYDVAFYGDGYPDNYEAVIDKCHFPINVTGGMTEYAMYVSGTGGAFIRANYNSSYVTPGSMDVYYGIYLANIADEMGNVVLERNSLNMDGAMDFYAVSVYDSPLIARNNIIASINSGYGGGQFEGFVLSSTAPTYIVNNTVKMRTNGQIARAISISNGQQHYLANNIFYMLDNSVESAIYENGSDSDVYSLKGNVFYSNTSTNYYFDFETGGNKSDIASIESMSDIVGDFSGNVIGDPVFVDGTGAQMDFHLLMSSPATDIGDNGIAYGLGVLFDFEGNHRPANKLYDAGAFELVIDYDADRLDDRDELYFGTATDNADFDSDGLLDGDEAYYFGTAATAPDSDGDGIDDGVEVAQGTNPTSVDTDGDTYFDGGDNCPKVSNDQADGDGDGIGDACDPCPIDNPDDTDGDTVCDSSDPFPLATTACGIDEDGDGCDDCSVNGMPAYWNDGPDIDNDWICNDGDQDADGDGYISTLYAGDDCDDLNGQINPGMEELPYDGIDNDCNANTSDDDFDHDGYVFGIDCDDQDVLINPEQIDIPDDGIDQDCNGYDERADISSGVFVSDIIGDDGNSGAPWDPLKTINAAIPFISMGARDIYIEGGVYSEAVTISGLNEVRIYGGYEHTSGWVRDPQLFPTYITESGSDTLVSTYGLGASSVIDGLSLTSQNSVDMSVYGIKNYDSNPRVSRIEFGSDFESQYLYGIYYYNSGTEVTGPVVITDCDIILNADSSTFEAHGIYVADGAGKGAILRGNKITSGYIGDGGNLYGISLANMPSGSTVVVEANGVTFDNAKGSTYGIWVSDTEVIAKNNIINLQSDGIQMAIGVQLASTLPSVLANNTIHLRNNGNSFGIKLDNGGNHEIYNNAIRVHDSGFNYGIYENASSADAQALANNLFDIEHGSGSTGAIYEDADGSGSLYTISGMESLGDVSGMLTNNLEGDAAFADVLMNDFHVPSTSPVINNGLDPVAAIGITMFTDIEGNYRPARGAFDIGAFEYIEDSDLDKLDNLDEAALGTNAGNFDTDSDGSQDGAEFFVWLTDPLNPDTDGDGIQDGIELSYGTNPHQPDTEYDGYDDQTDNCPTIYNPGQEDTDGDGTGDACDRCPLDNPDDSDFDTVCDSEDSYPMSATACGIDVEGDGCDDCAVMGYPVWWNDGPDGDGDGYCDVVTGGINLDIDGDGKKRFPWGTDCDDDGDGYGTYYPCAMTEGGTIQPSIDCDDTNVEGWSCMMNGTFSVAATIPTGLNPYAVYAADYNNDSYIDLAVVNYGANSMEVRLNIGDGTFLAAVTYATETQPRSITAGDYNDDGMLDLAVANYGSSTVNVFINQGAAVFADAVTISGFSNPTMIISYDMNNDGMLDLVSTNLGTNNIEINYNNGDGTFAISALGYGTGSSPYGLSFADIDGDDYADVLVSDYGSSQISVLHNNQDETYQTGGAYSLPVGANSRELAATDLDGDSCIDIVAVSTYDWTANVFINDGDGTYDNTVRADYSTDDYPVALVLADFDGDLVVDIATTNSDIASNNVSLLFNDGSGLFGASTEYPAGTTTRDIFTADLNHDMKLDLIVVNYDDSTLTILKGN